MRVTSFHDDLSKSAQFFKYVKTGENMANQFSSCFEKLNFYPSFKNDENDFLFTVIHFLVARKQITCSKATKIINFAASNSSLTLSFPYQIVFCFDGK